jgi:hypothetical protein
MPVIQINRSSEEGTRILKSFGTRDNPKKDPVEFNGDEIKNVCKPLSLSLFSTEQNIIALRIRRDG